MRKNNEVVTVSEGIYPTMLLNLGNVVSKNFYIISSSQDEFQNVRNQSHIFVLFKKKMYELIIAIYVYFVWKTCF